MKDQHQHRPCSSSSVSVSGKKKRKEFAESSSGGNNNNNNIGRTCTECGKIFWSWKALFGHMRCHPERRWRGINPPPNFRRQQPHPFTPEEQDCASSLILLSNAKPNKNKNKAVATTTVDDSSVQFVCSCCNKVFGSHQALGGHRASHKNVKGCFANTTITASSVDHDHDHHPIIMVPQTQTQTRDGYNNVGGNVEGEALGGHKCSICLRVFNTGQALGGHKRCHWEKGETTTPTIPFDSSSTATATANATTFNNKSSRVNVVDLNFPLPPPPPHHHHHSSSPLTLDLRG